MNYEKLTSISDSLHSIAINISWISIFAFIALIKYLFKS